MSEMDEVSEGQELHELEPVMLSALEHYSYCPRQCGLIHVECTFDENIYTMRGHLAHERVDTTVTRAERGVRVERGLPLWSRRLGLVGRADVVEFQGNVPYPVEYKVGEMREWEHETLQLCAQAMCLAEMLECEAPRGAIYYCASRKRREIVFTPELRAEVEQATRAIRTMLVQLSAPPAVHDRRCTKCSLVESCLPAVVVRPGRLRAYRAQLFSIEES